MSRTSVKIALLALLVVVCQGTRTLAGTTGGLTGYVILQDGSPLAAAGVAAASPSGSETTSTDASGHFAFVSLTPDTYVVTVTKDGYDTVSQAGITVIADNVQTVTLRTQRTAKVIAVIPVRAANELVRPGTTADVYSINASQAGKLANLGGGGGADSAYSAIAALPGAYVPPNQAGWFQTVHLRGGDYDQVGYEYDGVPVNRSFDNYPASTASNVGQNEVQVYTGAAPQNAESTGLSGFINQVIKNGTFPGFGNLDVAVGGPAYYNKLQFEVGGGTPSRTFTYYLATGGYSAAPRYVDPQNGSDLSAVWGPMFDLWSGSNGLGNGTGVCPYPTADSCAANYTGGSGIGGINGVLLGQASTALWGPAGYVLGPFNFGAAHGYADRENVVNLHFGLRHRNDPGADDIQVLYSNSLLRTPLDISNNDWGLNPFYTNTMGLAVFGPGSPCNALGASTISCGADNPAYFGLDSPGAYVSGFQSTMFPAGTAITSACAAPCGVIRYAFPSSGVQCQDLTRFCNGGFPLIPSGKQDATENGQGILKLQYQHNIGSTAYLRVYGYSYYSWWYLYGATSTNTYFVGTNQDYELITHTRGASAQFQDQLNDKNLLTAQIAGVMATTTRDNNTQMLNFSSGSRRRAWFLVDAANPFNGLCYGDSAIDGGSTTGSYGSCQPASTITGATRGAMLTYFGVAGGGIPAAPSVCGANFASPCAWLQGETGPYATYNDVKPAFYNGSLGDEWKPNQKLLLNLGIRFDNFQFTGGVTDHGNVSTFWFNAWNNGQCISALPGSTPVDKMEDLATYFTPLAAGAITPLTPCSAISDPTNPGHTYLAATLTNNSRQKFSYNTWEPRFGATYTMGSDDVLRASYGEYVQAPSSAFTFYNTLQNNLPSFLGNTFLAYGRTGPGYTNGFTAPSTSWNADLSWEHRFANSDASFKLSPYYRTTKNQYQLFFLNQKTSFVSGLPIGSQTAEGAEFQLQKGDFNRDGLSGLLSYTYLWTYVKYGNLPNVPGGSGQNNALVNINNAIKTYNGYTSFCAANPADARCGLPTNLLAAAPCYTTAGLPAPTCAAGTVANPYWNAPVQSLFDPNGKYLPFGIFPAIFNSDVQSYATPNTATLVLNWKHDKLSITPAIQYYGEGFYGAPLQTLGVDPANNNIPGQNAFAETGVGGGCNATLGTGFPDPRYPFGPPAVGTGGAPYDATSCNTNILIPDPYTGKFDNLGAFRGPQQLVAHLQISYEATPRITYVAGLNNIINTCWGGSKMPWTLSDHRVCSYTFEGFGNFLSYTGNFYNPDSTFQPQFKYPYIPAWGPANDNGTILNIPFQASFEVKVRL